MKNSENTFTELTPQELEDIDGGLVLTIALAGLYLATFMAGYTIGKDLVQNR